MTSPDQVSDGSSLRGFLKDSDQANVLRYDRVYNGKGAINVKFFFREEGFPNPARILVYTIPPGASEGVHVHMPGDAKLGSFDEFYYVISGSGEMEIEGKRVPVTAGDHIFAPALRTASRTPRRTVISRYISWR